MLPYLSIFLITLSASLLLTPLIRRLALRMGVLDDPDERKVHSEPVPYFGGMVIYLVFVSGMALAFRLYPEILGGHQRAYMALSKAGMVVLLLGIYDDMMGSSATIKVIVQFIASYILIEGGFKIDVLTNPLGDPIRLGIWVWPVTCLWLIGISNAMNLIDGLDGLAGGVAFIASASIFACALYWGKAFPAFLTLALAGSVLGFLKYNFYPARIFMGDAGALFLGFTLAAISMMMGSKGSGAVALLIPITALGVPVFDTLTAILRRVNAHQHVFHADLRHLHHRLLNLGLSQRQVVLLIYLVCFCLGLLAFASVFIPRGLSLILLGILVLSMAMAATALAFVEKGRETRAKENVR